MIIFAGDIGGTKSNLGIFETGQGSQLNKLDERSVPTTAFGTPEQMMTDFLAGRWKPDAACFGIAGPVNDGVCRGENLPWKEVRETGLADALNLRRTKLLNDLEATSNGVRFLSGDQLVTLHAGEPHPRGNIAVIAAGTGLGEGGLVYHNGRYEPLASEGGHTDLAVRNEEEIELLRYLFTIERPVNQEAVLCGSGLLNVYNFMKATGRAQEPAWLAAELRQTADKDKPGLISRVALEHRAEIGSKALDLFVAMYGARAGNLALSLMSTGGVFVGGGIAPKNIVKMKDGTFVRNLQDKGAHFKPIIEKFPVHVVMEQKTALIGAAQYAREHHE